MKSVLEEVWSIPDVTSHSGISHVTSDPVVRRVRSVFISWVSALLRGVVFVVDDSVRDQVSGGDDTCVV